MTDESGGRTKIPAGGHSDGRGLHPPARPECTAVRHEIMMAVFHETEAVVESVTLHISECPSCREWEADLKRMHSLCGCAGGSAGPGGLTEAALAAIDPARGEGELGGAAATGPPGRGALAVSLVAIVLANAAFASLLEGPARALYPAVSLLAMLVATLWVQVDSRRRGARSAFWTALQPLTVPVGVVAYLLCRERETARCPACGTVSPARNRFCAVCGKRLQDACCRCGKSVRREYRICPWCGAPLSDCFPSESAAGSSCGWSGAQIAFVLAANAALVAALLVAILGAGGPGRTAAAALYVLGLVPIFNWTVLDSRRRAMHTIGWGVLALLAGYVGFVVYLACRGELVSECPVCGGFPPSSFNFCPCCGSLMNPACPRCGAAGSGSYCASCGAALRAGG
ncbi:MAG: hypothetical protein C4574_04385 [Candidatus Latescibacterota bacterium]|nr:MAG: hypothetical protein C4574_04385 [Candidatus Latescibacterota bacterium]